MNGKTCFFIGGRHSSNNIREPLTEVVERHIVEYGVTTFTVGKYGNFDSIARGVLIETKKRHSEIELYLLTPYALTQKGIKTPDGFSVAYYPDGFDGTVYPDGLEKVPLRLAIVQANRYMVNNSDYLIAHQGIGNSRNLVEYAQKREKRGLIKVTLL